MPKYPNHCIVVSQYITNFITNTNTPERVGIDMVRTSTTARVDGDRLVLNDTPERLIKLETPEWFEWLESAKTFTFTGSSGSFIARKEARSRGGWYWKAYHTAHGTLHRAYLGRSSDLTLDRLNRAAAKLAAAASVSAHKDSTIQTQKSPSASAPGPESTSALPANLLATKLIIPPARAQLVARPRLFERLEAGLQSKLTLIAAPAGFGKTTLLSSWRTTAAPDNAPPLAWVSLDSGDNDPLLFWSYVLAAIDAVVSGIGNSALTLLQSPQPPLIEHILTHFLNGFTRYSAAKEGHNLFLVLEDYHVITNPAIHAALAWLLDCLPATMHLIIVTRVDPPLPLARLRVNGDLTELHADDLRFTPEETTAFLNQIMGLALTSDDLAALEDRTEGWIAGLQLAALALRDHRDRTDFIRTFSGNNRYIVDYLVSEVLERQPAHLQSFLLHTSILDRMCGPLCDTLLGLSTPPSSSSQSPLSGQAADAKVDPNTLSALQALESAGDVSGQSMLEELERANLFVISLDEDRHWYRYHHLFATVLRQRLARSVTATATTDALHESASRWFEQQGLVAEAIHHALMIADGVQAARLIERHGLSTIVGGQVQTGLGWLSRLPQDLLSTRPLLCIFYSLALLFTNDLSAAEKRLQDAEHSIGPDTPAADAHFTQGYAAAIRANIATYTGDLAACASYGEQVLCLLPDTEVIARTMARLHIARASRVTGDVTVASLQRAIAAIDPIRASGNLLGTLTSIINVARLQELQGRLRAAAETYQQLVQISNGLEELRGLHGGGLPYYVGMGDLHREWNDLNTAGDYLAQALELQAGMGTVDAEYVTRGYLALARLQHASGEHARVEETLSALKNLAQRRSFVPHLVTRARALQAQLALATGNLPAAISWAEASGLHWDDDISFPREGEYLVFARVLIARAGSASGSAFLSQALHLLDRLMADAIQKGRGSSELEILLVRALALRAQGNSSAARAALIDALELAAPEGYVRRFVDEGPEVRALLQTVNPGAVTGAPGYIPLLLAAFAGEQGPRSGVGLPGAVQFVPTPPVVSSPPPGLRTGLGLEEPLTERELEVLRLIASGQSNAEIAQSLVIALSTVKTHTNSIFGKLGAVSRTQAVSRARDLQLL
ncbi:MAG TPA: LuxR C-terminal-related transcriptional regulator [Chloroflexia bacterium]|nr:LuxR C-terminal-related transcriptional regulator [Chloroflexia bacterium]